MWLGLKLNYTVYHNYTALTLPSYVRVEQASNQHLFRSTLQFKFLKFQQLIYSASSKFPVSRASDTLRLRFRLLPSCRELQILLTSTCRWVQRRRRMRDPEENCRPTLCKIKHQAASSINGKRFNHNKKLKAIITAHMKLKTVFQRSINFAKSSPFFFKYNNFNYFSILGLILIGIS